MTADSAAHEFAIGYAAAAAADALELAAVSLELARMLADAVVVAGGGIDPTVSATLSQLGHDLDRFGWTGERDSTWSGIYADTKTATANDAAARALERLEDHETRIKRTRPPSPGPRPGPNRPPDTEGGFGWLTRRFGQPR